MNHFAYIDPGTGSLFIQATIGVVLAAGVMFRSTLRRVISAIKPNSSIFEKLISKTHSSSSVSGAGPPSAVTDMTSIQIAIGNIQGSIDAAIAEVATAKSPAQRASAQQKLSALMMQKMRLEAQLGEAKKREINRLRI